MEIHHATQAGCVISHPASRWPAATVALSGAQPQVAEVLGRLRVPDFLPAYPSVEEALDAVAARSPYLRDDLLHIAVRDGSPRLLRLVTVPDPEAPGGRGLWLVEQLATGWGVNCHPDGGNVIWCTLSL